jgi:hypothetical protein
LRENVETVERIYAAARTPLALETYAPNIEWDLTNYVG